MGIKIHSGGALGTDQIFEQFAIDHCIPYIIFSFIGHQTSSKNRKILSNGEIHKSIQYIKKAAKKISRYIERLNWYRLSLVCRNYYIIKNYSVVLAFGKIVGGKILGGTAWGCELALEYNIPVFIFDIQKLIWNRYRGCDKIFECLPQEFIDNTSIIAGIGTQSLDVDQKIIVKKEIEKLLLPIISEREI